MRYPKEKLSTACNITGSGYGSRTRVPGVRGRYPRPLDEPTDGHLIKDLRKVGDSNPRYGKPVRQFSKLVVSATHPTFLKTETMCS